MKPYKGQIEVNGIIRYEGGYVYKVSFWHNHPEFGTKPGGFGAHTSLVIKDDRNKPRPREAGYQIETLNSRYTVIPGRRQHGD